MAREHYTRTAEEGPVVTLFDEVFAYVCTRLVVIAAVPYPLWPDAS